MGKTTDSEATAVLLVIWGHLFTTYALGPPKKTEGYTTFISIVWKLGFFF